MKKYITVRQVGLSPAEYTAQHDHDDDVLRTKPGLYPDPLFPVEDVTLTALPSYWQSLWFTVELDNQVSAGTYPITVLFKTEDGDVLSEETFTLDVIGLELPEQELIHTRWFHTDSIATYYDLEPMSDPYWEMVETYLKTAVKYGINMILTPLFTPALDTAVGHERPTIQLVDVEKNADHYTFNFQNLSRWVDMCNRNGVQYFEFSHLFTQWGAEHAPKIMGCENETYKRLFGWETDALGDDYTHFLKQFFPAIIEFIKEHQLDERVYFHISDEPRPHHIERYGKLSKLVNEYLADYPVMDALSNIEFYKEGIVKKPIPGTDRIEPFLEADIPDLWTYYCVSQYKDVSNQFFVFPSARNRILGMQLYKFDIAGFLHWSYNFWYSMLSLKQDLNPYEVTDADKSFPAGEPFNVYPGKEGPIASLRFEVFREGLQDLRALKLLESYIGKAAVIDILEADLEKPITFKQYPRGEQWLLNKREEINHKIKTFVN